MQERDENLDLGLQDLARLFARIGCLSWGGGGATLAMLHREFCLYRPLLPDAEFQVLFGISRMVPGMNLLALSVLLGHRFRGWPGAVVALAALTAPAFGFIILLCLLLGGRSPSPWVTGAVRGLAPAALALLFQTAWQLAGSGLKGQRFGRQLLWMAVATAAALAALFVNVQPAWIVVGAALVGVGVHARRVRG